MLARWNDARRNTDSLFALVQPEALYARPVPERHRLVFYLGHLEAFDWNLLRASLGLTAFHPEFDRLFAFGIDPPDGGAPTDTPCDWPSAQEVRHYVCEVRLALDGRIGDAPEQLLHVAIEHRLMHAETLAYLLHALPHENKVCAAGGWETGAGTAPRNQAVAIPGGTATLGRRRGDGFGWDNEFEEHRVHVGSFAIDRFKVTNGDYLEFVEAGAPPPYFWRQTGREWLLRTMFADALLPLDWPVYVSQAEATAYAGWKGRRLPTEAEFHRAAYGSPDGRERNQPWGDAPASELRGNFDFAAWDPCPVHATPGGDSAFGVAQMVGNGWEWTSTAFAPFPGFKPFSFYPGYSADFFDGDHYVLKGGSPRTAACLLRRSFRNWFRPRYPYAFATFRCVLRGSEAGGH